MKHSYTCHSFFSTLSPNMSPNNENVSEIWKPWQRWEKTFSKLFKMKCGSFRHTKQAYTVALEDFQYSIWLKYSSSPFMFFFFHVLCHFWLLSSFDIQAQKLLCFTVESHTKKEWKPISLKESVLRHKLAGENSNASNATCALLIPVLSRAVSSVHAKHITQHSKIRHSCQIHKTWLNGSKWRSKQWQAGEKPDISP